MNGRLKALRNTLRLFLFLGPLLSAGLFGSCALFPGGGFDSSSLPRIYPDSIPAQEPGWAPLADGIDFCSFKDPSIPIILYGVRIDLKNPAVSITASSPIEGSSILKGETTLEFAERTGSTVALNTSPYDYPNGRFSKNRVAVGLAVEQGRRYSEPSGSYAAILFMKDKQAVIIPQQTEEAIPRYTEYAAGGFWTVLQGGLIVPSQKQISDSRTALGTSDSGRFLYILAADGEKPSRSRGLTSEETGAWLIWMGAEDGLQMDGGGSTTLVIRQQLKLLTIVNNSAVQDPQPKGRIVANNLGFIVNK